MFCLHQGSLNGNYFLLGGGGQTLQIYGKFEGFGNTTGMVGLFFFLNDPCKLGVCRKVLKSLIPQP